MNSKIDDDLRDDDLPLLTHVLRTGDGRIAAPLTTSLDHSYVDEFGGHHFEDAAVTRQIVIGHDPHQQIDDLVAATVHGNASPTGNRTMPDARRPLRDPFRLAQDVDHAAPPAETIAEPEIIARVGHAQGPSAAPRERTIEAPNPMDVATLSARLRDSIFIDLASRIDVELDARIAQALHAEVEVALAQLQGNLRAHLTEALRDVVARAVEKEMARIRQTMPADQSR